MELSEHSAMKKIYMIPNHAIEFFNFYFVITVYLIYVHFALCVYMYVIDAKDNLVHVYV